MNAADASVRVRAQLLVAAQPVRKRVLKVAHPHLARVWARLAAAGAVVTDCRAQFVSRCPLVQKPRYSVVKLRQKLVLKAAKLVNLV